MERNHEMIKNFPSAKREFWENILQQKESLEEIRIRADKPVLLRQREGEWYVDAKGRRTKELGKAYRMSFVEVQELVDYWCKDSRYAFQKELKNGYLTLRGGHRIGICGETVLDAQGKIQTVKNISSLNIRLAHECRQAAEKILPFLYEGEGLQNTLIISPPGAGKTTLLRDLVRRISDGNEVSEGKIVGLIDERGEIAASFQGIPQLEVGLRTDVMDGCLKEEGMIRLLRSMGPQVIAIDELGNTKEIDALLKMAGCGCSILATVHGSGLEEIKKKKMFRELWEQRIFERILVLQRKKGEFCSFLYKAEELANQSAQTAGGK